MCIFIYVDCDAICIFVCLVFFNDDDSSYVSYDMDILGLEHVSLRQAKSETNFI